MTKVAPKALSFESERPLTIAAMACSRTPKCRFRPLGVSASKSPALVGNELLPPAARLRAALADAAVDNLAHPVRDEEPGILWPAISAFREPHFLLAQRLAMSRGRVDLVGRAIADVTVEDDQGRPAFGLAEHRECILDPLEVVRIADPEHVPVIAEEAGRNVLGERDARIALDADMVVVVDPTELIETEMPGQ